MVNYSSIRGQFFHFPNKKRKRVDPQTYAYAKLKLVPASIFSLVRDSRLRSHQCQLTLSCLVAVTSCQQLQTLWEKLLQNVCTALDSRTCSSRPPPNTSASADSAITRAWPCCLATVRIAYSITICLICITALALRFQNKTPKTINDPRKSLWCAYKAYYVNLVPMVSLYIEWPGSVTCTVLFKDVGFDYHISCP